MMGWIGVNPQKGYSTQQICLFIITFTSQWSIIGLVILYLIYEAHITISDVTNALESLFLTFHAIVKLTLLFAKKNKLNDLLERTKYFWTIENTGNKQQKNEHLKYLKFIKMSLLMYNALCIATTLSFTCKPFFVKGDYLTFTTYKPDWIPFYAMVFYEALVFIFGLYCAVPGLDMFIIALLLLLKMQFKLLNQEIERVFQEIAKPGENLGNIDAKIKRIVDYHNFLLDYVNRINRAFSEGMMAYIITIVMSMCVEMYIVSTQNSIVASLKAVVYMTNGLIEYIICYCLPGQAITDEAERTRDYVYFGKWYEHPVYSVKVAQIMVIGRAQRKTLILAGSYVKIDLETSLITLKTMISYAMFLRTMGIRDN